jgi:hypothetical protein
MPAGEVNSALEAASRAAAAASPAATALWQVTDYIGGGARVDPAEWVQIAHRPEAQDLNHRNHQGEIRRQKRSSRRRCC